MTTRLIVSALLPLLALSRGLKSSSLIHWFKLRSRGERLGGKMWLVCLLSIGRCGGILVWLMARGEMVRGIVHWAWLLLLLLLVLLVVLLVVGMERITTARWGKLSRSKLGSWLETTLVVHWDRLTSLGCLGLLTSLNCVHVSNWVESLWGFKSWCLTKLPNGLKLPRWLECRLLVLK